MVDTGPSGFGSGAGQRIPTSKSELLSLIAALLEEEPEDLDEHENLIEYGIDSIGVMRIVSLWNREGLDITVGELFAEPTIAAWWNLLSECTATGTADDTPVDVDLGAPFELSPVQHAYWVGRADGQVLGGVGCHVYLEVDGAGVDADGLERAVLAVAERHPMLRARFLEDGTQQIMPKAAWTGLPRHDLRDLDEAAAERELTRIRSQLSHRRLAVERGEVFDVRLSLLPGGRTRLHIELDLLVADVLSFNVFLDDLAACYADGAEALRPLTYSFPQYRADLERSRSSAYARDREYWMSRLADLPPAPRLPLAQDPARLERPVFRRLAHRLEPEAYERLVQVSRRNQVTPAMALATAFAEILGRWSGQSRLLLNLPLFDRVALHDDVVGMIADFTNLVLLDVDLSGDSFLDRVRTVQRRFQADISHSAYSAVEVLRDISRHADLEAQTAPVVFASNANGGELLSGRFRQSFGELGYSITQTPQVWLDHQLMDMDGGLYLNWDFVEGLFPEGVVEGMFEAYCGVLEWLVEGDWSSVAPVGLPAGQVAVRARVGETGAPESGRLLHEGFFERAGAEPGRVALVWGEDGELSYGELAEWALRVAGGLVACGVEAGDAVAVTVPKGPGQVAAILGVLAAGGVYVPVGVDQPAARRSLMFEAAGVRCAVVDGAGGSWPSGVRVLELGELGELGSGSAGLSAPVVRGVSDSAYVIFTSGSTGQPKGVEVSHRAAVNTVEDINERFGVGADDRVLAVSAADFDLSVYDMFGLLAVGGALVLIEEGDRREAQRWVELCRRHGVTVWNSVPALFDMYVSVAEARGLDDRLRLVLVSGDWVGLDLPGRFRERCPGGRFVAMGGATEAAIWSNAIEVDRVPEEWRSIPYGFALRNQRYRVVDQAGRDCPDWVPGELWIGGVGVAEGYRGDPVKTAEKFVERGGERWYRTGDLGRFWADGTLEFLGRADHQVKVRGFRIELGEIESVLEAHPHIGRAVVTTIGTGNQQKLVAAIVTDPTGGTATPDALTAPAPTVEIIAETAADSAEVEAALIESWMAGVIRAGITDSPAPLDEVARALGTADGMRGALRLWLDWLVMREVLACEDHAYAIGKRWQTALDPRTWQANLELAVGAVRATADRLAEMSETVAGILRGERDPLILLEDPVLSPEAAVTNRPDTESALRGLADTVDALAAELGRPVRVAELGARSGIAARRLLETVAPGHIDLTLFDAAPRLLESAEERLAGLPHSTAYRVVRDGVLPSESRHAFDVVLANNSLHRYADAVAGAAEARQLLVPGGVLIGLEHSELAPIGLLTAGLIEHGFSPRAGGRARAGGPLLDKAEWADVLQEGGLRDATITERDDTSLMLLVARTAADLPVVRETEVLALAREQLPAHMVPERVLMLPVLPLSANGKVDRSRIGALFAEQPDPGDGGEAPRTPMEETVSEMWAELLHTPEVGRAHNFFALGGDSLTATRFAEAIRARFGVELALRQMFQEPTVAAVAALIDGSLEMVGAADGSMEDGVL